MRQFFKFTLASMVGFILAYVFIVFISIIIFFAGMGALVNKVGIKSPSEEKATTPVLLLDLSAPIQERTSDDPFENLGQMVNDMPSPLSLKNILAKIDKAKDDPSIEGILIETNYMNAGYATVDEIRNALIEFKSSGKFIYSYSDFLDQKAYYLSSVADSIFLQPEGILNFAGLHSELIFLKGTFEKLGVEPRVMRAGKFKSAGEMFSNKEMSDPNREQYQALLNSMYDHLLNGISESRNIPVPELRNIAENYLIRDAEDAVTHKMIHKLAYRDQVYNSIRLATGMEKDEKIRLKNFRHYKAEEWKENGGDKIAIIYAVGSIMMGEGDMNSIGSINIPNAIRKAREDDDVKAIVLRVNSPGGSALASDVIWREVKLTKGVKPIVVSMGDVAASGGYYIACPADKIFAQPNTITGSIGVIGILFKWQDFWNDKIGVTFDRVKTGKFADLGNPNRDMYPEEEQIIQEFIDDTYQEFISRVAEGRNMPISQIDSLGQGRVWTGEQAIKIGLVDQLGNLEDAINEAAEMSGLEDYELELLPRPKDPFAKFIRTFGGASRESVIKGLLGEDYPIYKKVKSSREMENGIHYLWAEELNVR